MPKPPIVSNAWFSMTAAGKMLAEVKRQHPLETGGLLVGYRYSSQVVVVDVIGPGPKAKHGRWSFTPDYDWHDREIAKIYENSGRLHTYLGDWHSHPNGDGTLSLLDLDTLDHIARSKSSRANSPFMAIVHGKLIKEVTLWSYRVQGRNGAEANIVANISLYSEIAHL